MGKGNTVRQATGPHATLGLTLVEVLAVVAIAGMLSALLLPALSRAREGANRAACANNLRELGVAFELYGLENGETYPAAQDPVSTEPYYWLWMGRGWRRLLAEYVPGEKDDPGVFYCPSDVRPKSVEVYERTSYGYSIALYHSPEQIDATDSFEATFSNPMPAIPQRMAAVRYPSKKVLLAEWYANHAAFTHDPGWFGWGGKRNYLFADGHVEFLDSNAILAANDGLPNPNLTRGGITGRDIP